MTFIQPKVQTEAPVSIPSEIPLETWVPATWETFVALADQPAYAQKKGYYYQGHMRFEPMSTGSDHSNDHALIMFALSFFAAFNRIPMTAKDGCFYRKVAEVLNLKISFSNNRHTNPVVS